MRMNFKRHKPKEFRTSSCGVPCRYDGFHMHGNGVYRYKTSYWKKLLGGKNGARYIHKNVKEYEGVVDLPS